MNEPLTSKEKVCGDELRIIYEHGQPHGIRDRSGFLFFFRKVSKYDGQEERYRRELKQMERLADFLLSVLRADHKPSAALPSDQEIDLFITKLRRSSANVAVWRDVTRQWLRDVCGTGVAVPPSDVLVMLREMFYAQADYGCGFYSDDRWRAAYKALAAYAGLEWDFLTDRYVPAVTKDAVASAPRCESCGRNQSDGPAHWPTCTAAETSASDEFCPRCKLSRPICEKLYPPCI